MSARSGQGRGEEGRGWGDDGLPTPTPTPQLSAQDPFLFTTGATSLRGGGGIEAERPHPALSSSIGITMRLSEMQGLGPCAAQTDWAGVRTESPRQGGQTAPMLLQAHTQKPPGGGSTLTKCILVLVLLGFPGSPSAVATGQMAVPPTPSPYVEIPLSSVEGGAKAGLQLSVWKITQ